MRRSHPAPRALLLLVCASVCVGAAAQEVPAAQPAEWRSYDLLVQLQDLPHTYSCDDLWYKLRDVLLKLGARAYMTLTPYHCGVTGGGPATSPSLELKFQLPSVVSGQARRYAQISVVDETVHLAPGSPPSLSDRDCQLMRQLQGTLFAALPLHVTAANFSCTPPRSAFALNVQVPITAGREAAAQPPSRR